MNSDDPKLTAFALDELDPADRAEIEQLLRDDPAALHETRRDPRLRRHPPPAPRRRARGAAARKSARRGAGNCRAGAPPARGQPKRSLYNSGNAPPFLTALAASIVVLAGVAGVWGLMRYEGYVAVLAGSGISDPRSLRLNGAEQMVVRIGDAITGQHLAENPQLEMAERSPTFVPAQPPASAPDASALASNTPTTAPEFSLNPAPAPGMKALGDVKRNELVASTAPNVPPTMVGRAGGAARLAARGGSSRQLSAAAPRAAQPTDYDFDTMSRGIRYSGQTREEETRFPEPTTNTEAYDAITDNAFLAVRDNPLSTFSIDVDTASYANVRRFLNEQHAPAERRGADRGAGQLLHLRLPAAAGRRALLRDDGSGRLPVGAGASAAPHRPEGPRDSTAEQRPPSNLVFLIDVSGSMQPANKLPLVQASPCACSSTSSAPKDRVAIVVYAGASGMRARADHRQERRSATRSIASKPAARPTARAGIQARLRPRAAALHQRRHQPRDPRDRRRFQRRRDEPGRPRLD